MDLTISGVGTRLGGRWVVDGVDATPPPGRLTGLLGPNGAGKTTLL
ncbi:ATP-binding cassette domain-containing protein, partial [Cellulomonas septica]|nr:ATP-binding cassette domain-containing protein [Cellulomonas septica]